MALTGRLRKEHDRLSVRDRLYRSYDFNPLVSFPLVRPWKASADMPSQIDRMVAPLPNLLLNKVATGVYNMMLDTYGMEFTQWFGYAFEEYVGEVLQASVDSALLFSEEDIRKAGWSRKAADWVVLDGTTVILIECKATSITLRRRVWLVKKMSRTASRKP